MTPDVPQDPTKMAGGSTSGSAAALMFLLLLQLNTLCHSLPSAAGSNWQDAVAQALQ
jgi:hypothetical protein